MAILLNRAPSLSPQGELVRMSIPNGKTDFLMPLEVLGAFCAAAEADFLAPWRASGDGQDGGSA